MISNPTPIGKKRVRLQLNGAERAELINAAARIYAAKPVNGIWAAVSDALVELPPHRRPTLAKAKTWGWLKPSVEQQAELIRSAQRPAPTEASQPKPEPTPATKVDLSTVAMEELLREISSRIALNVTQTVRDVIRTELLHITMPPAPKAPPVQRVTKPRVIIIGLLPNQEKMIRAEYSERLDLRFYKSNASGATWSSTAFQSADHVLGMVSFMSHANQDQIQKAVKHYTRVPGGMTDLRNTLDGIVRTS